MNLSIDPKDAGEIQPRKFMFDRSFDDAAIVHRAQERKPVVLKPEQYDALKQESFDAGFAEGQKAGKDAQTAHLDATVAKIDASMGILIKSIAALAEEQQLHTRQLALSIVKKMLPQFAARNGMQEIEALLNDSIREMAREPRLVVRVQESEFDAVNERVQAIATQRAYSGKVIVLADAEIQAGDCRIEWADGGVERNSHSTMQSIEQTLLPTN
jgi:flagellar assembly protein FliH